jgi:acetylornithine deacetylase
VAGLRGDIRIETVIEEECTGNGAAACRARGPRTDAALIPEPFNHAALVAQVGVLWARVTIEGRAAHAERADQAENAALKALPVIQAIQALEAEVNERSAMRLNYNVGVVRAGDWASSVPEECVLEVRLAADPGEDLEAVKARFESVIDGRFAALADAHRAVHAGELEYLSFTGTTDARAFVVHGATPATCYGPIGANLHAPDEWVDLESVKATTLVLALAAADWCG